MLNFTRSKNCVDNSNNEFRNLSSEINLDNTQDELKMELGRSRAESDKEKSFSKPETNKNELTGHKETKGHENTENLLDTLNERVLNYNVPDENEGVQENSTFLESGKVTERSNKNYSEYPVSTNISSNGETIQERNGVSNDTTSDYELLRSYTTLSVKGMDGGIESNENKNDDIAVVEDSLKKKKTSKISDDNKMSIRNKERAINVIRNMQKDNNESENLDPHQRYVSMLENILLSFLDTSPSSSDISAKNNASHSPTVSSPVAAYAERDICERLRGSEKTDEDIIPPEYRNRCHEDYFRNVEYEETPRSSHTGRPETREGKKSLSERSNQIRNAIPKFKISLPLTRNTSDQGPEMRRCPQCFLHVKPNRLKIHLESHRHTPGNSNFICLWCRFSSDSAFELLSHYGKKHFRCPICKLVSGIQQNRLRHILTCHNNSLFYSI